MTFSQLVETYGEQIRGLIDGGVDLLLPETTFDTLNLKACLFAIEKLFEEKNIRLPVFASVTITDRSGRTLSGQTLDAFLASISHANLTAVGINCAFGPDLMAPFVEELARLSPLLVFAYPNAGLPDRRLRLGSPESRGLGAECASGWTRRVVELSRRLLRNDA